MHLIGLSVSLRKASLNTALLRAASELMAAGWTIAMHTLHGIPLHDGDVEAAGFPEVVTKFKEEIITADGLVLVTPEYNNSIPGIWGTEAQTAAIAA